MKAENKDQRQEHISLLGQIKQAAAGQKTAGLHSDKRIWGQLWTNFGFA